MKMLTLIIVVLVLLAALAEAAGKAAEKKKAVEKKQTVGTGTGSVWCKEPSLIAPKNGRTTTDTTTELGGAGGHVCIIAPAGFIPKPANPWRFEGTSGGSGGSGTGIVKVEKRHNRDRK